MAKPGLPRGRCGSRTRASAQPVARSTFADDGDAARKSKSGHASQVPPLALWASPRLKPKRQRPFPTPTPERLTVRDVAKACDTRPATGGVAMDRSAVPKPLRDRSASAPFRKRQGSRGRALGRRQETVQGDEWLPDDSNEDGFTTVKYVAGFYSVHPRTIRNWIKRGKLPAQYLAGILRIPRSALKNGPKK